MIIAEYKLQKELSTQWDRGHVAFLKGRMSVIDCVISNQHHIPFKYRT